jgi:hypothetical protein
MAWADDSPQQTEPDIEEERGQAVHIEDFHDLDHTSKLPSLLRVQSHSDDSYDAQLAADLAGTTPTQSDFSPSRFSSSPFSSRMTATTPSPQRTGVSPSSSPRLPSPPPFTEVQIGPKSPTIGDGPENQLGEAAKQDDGATRRIRPGTKAADMASGPPLIPLSEVMAPFLLSVYDPRLTSSSSSNRPSNSKNTSKPSITPTPAAQTIPLLQSHDKQLSPSLRPLPV